MNIPDNVWTIIETHLPDYSRRDDVLLSDRLEVYILEPQEMEQQEFDRIEKEYGDKEAAQKFLDQLTLELYAESLAALLETYGIDPAQPTHVSSPPIPNRAERLSLLICEDENRYASAKEALILLESANDVNPTEYANGVVTLIDSISQHTTVRELLDLI